MLVESVCEQCHSPYMVRRDQLEKRGRKYCSRHCQIEAMKRRETFICRHCTKPFERPVSRIATGETVYCSKACQSAHQKLENAPNWKGGNSKRKDGYIHNGHENREQHRIIMERHIGRPLLRTEHVHHINLDKSDNRIENLEILSPSEHAKRHGFGTKIRPRRG